jgi:oligosaccharide repeat unit polymerase
MLMERFSAYTFSLALLAMAFILRRGTGTWGTPAGLMCFYWFLFTFIPLAAMPAAPINPLAMAYIVVACLAFSIPALVSEWKGCMEENARLSIHRTKLLDNKFLWTIFVASSSVSVVFVAIDLLVQGLSFRDLIFNFFEAANQYMGKRYEGELRRNIFGQWGLVTCYFAAILGGLLYASPATIHRKLVMVAAMVPSVAILLIQAAKGMFFLSIALFVGGIWIFRTLRDVRPHVDFSGMLSYFRYVIVALPLVVISFLTRGLYKMDDASQVLDALLAYLRAYAFMHLYAFSDWFSYWLGQPSLLIYAAEAPADGYFSFIFLFQLLGSSKEVPPGVYDEYFFVDGTNPGNLYTVFRGLITDFGLFGSLGAMALAGYAMNASYRHMLVRQHPGASIGVMFVFVDLLYTQYVVGAFMWLTTFVLSVLAVALFVINRFILGWLGKGSQPVEASR